MNDDFRGLWLWERKLAKYQGEVTPPKPRQPTTQPTQDNEDRGLTYFF
jgi:hypothetical protein